MIIIFLNAFTAEKKCWHELGMKRGFWKSWVLELKFQSCWISGYRVSISPKFYKQFFSMKVLCTPLMYLQFLVCILLAKGRNCAKKLLIKCWRNWLQRLISPDFAFEAKMRWHTVFGGKNVSQFQSWLAQTNVIALDNAVNTCCNSMLKWALRCQFHQRSTSSLQVPKVQKTAWLDSLFCAFGICASKSCL